MGKYEKIGRHLALENNTEVKYSFSEIESILGFSLPKSAGLYRPWWANDITHVQTSDGWLKYGWKVKSVDMKDQIVTFQKKGEEQKEIQNEGRQMPPTTPAEFEALMRDVMSRHYKKSLSTGEVEGVSKLFDLVSEDKEIVGEVKYLTMVRGVSLPPAKFSVIAEHIWLLEKTNARIKFLVFGNDRRVPEEWLNRYGELVKNVKFFFYEIKNNQLYELN